MDNYLHIHPAIKELTDIQLLLQVQFCQSETEEEISEEQLENEESLEMRRISNYEQNLPFDTKINVKEKIEKNNKELADRVISQDEMQAKT